MVLVDPDIHNLFMVGTAMRLLVVVGTGEYWLIQLFSYLYWLVQLYSVGYGLVQVNIGWYSYAPVGVHNVSHRCCQGEWEQRMNNAADPCRETTAMSHPQHHLHHHHCHRDRHYRPHSHHCCHHIGDFAERMSHAMILTSIIFQFPNSQELNSLSMMRFQCQETRGL